MIRDAEMYVYYLKLNACSTTVILRRVDNGKCPCVVPNNSTGNFHYHRISEGLNNSPDLLQRTFASIFATEASCRGNPILMPIRQHHICIIDRERG